jgi:hypothetical protein
MTRTMAGPTTSRSDHAPAPRGRATTALAIVLAVAIALPLASTAFGLYDRIEHWGKLVHAIDGACATFIFGMLLFGWRDRTRTDLTDELATLLTILAGILFGVIWEIIEFVFDWVAYSDLQKSNTDTMTDFLWNDLMTIAAALLAMRVYCHVASADDRPRLGDVAEWLVDGPSRVLDRHGLALAVIGGALIAATVAALWFSGRPVPGLPIP